MKYIQARASDQKTLLNSNLDPKRSRIDCFTVNLYFKVDDYQTYYFKIFDPTIYGINQLKEKDINIMPTLNEKLGILTGNSNQGNDLAAKLAAKKTGNSNQGNDLAAKLKDKKPTFNDQSEMNTEKFFQVEQLRETISNQSVLIQDLINRFLDLEKVAIENNSLIAVLSKDQKSTLNAVNSLAAKFKDPIIKADKASDQNNDQVIINRKQHAIAKPANPINTPQLFLLFNECQQDQDYQGIYNLFKKYFSHKFAKSSKADQLPDFIEFGSTIDLYSLQSINDTCRLAWQNYRSKYDRMVFAPGSMELAITSLIQVAIDLEYLQDKTPIVDKKAKPEKINAINEKFADPSLIDNTKDNKQPSVVKDFKYWSNALTISIEVIRDIIALIKNKGTTPEVMEVIIDHCIENSKVDIDGSDQLAEFYDYLKETNFA
jgi:hypothetical protein